jgi:hypothetical protein
VEYVDIQEAVYRYGDYVIFFIVVTVTIFGFSSLIFEEVDFYWRKMVEPISEKVAYLFMALITVGIVPYLRWHDKYEARKIIEAVKNDYKPLVSDNLLVQSSKVEEVYSKCVYWLNNRGAEIYEEDYPGYILAFEAGSYSFTKPTIPENVKEWAKFFKFTLSQNGVHVDVLFEIYQGWKKINIESYEKRIAEYPKIVSDFKRYVILNE